MLAALIRYRPLVRNLVFKDLKLKYRDSALGIVWSLLNPLLMLGVYTLAFRYILRVQVENYAYFLFVGLLPWNFFAASALGSTRAIIDNGGLIKKVHFPAETLPLATVLFNLAQLLLAFAVFLPALIFVSGRTMHWTVLLFLPVVVLHVIFTFGLALVLAAATVLFRDVAHLTEVALLLLFWATPIIYPVTMAPPRLQPFFRANPLAAFAIAYQDALFWGRTPDGVAVLSLLGWTGLILAIGAALFRRQSPRFAEEV